MGLRRGGVIRPGEEVRGNGEQVSDEGAGVFAALGALACVSLRRWVRSDSVFFFFFFFFFFLFIYCYYCCYRTFIFPLCHESFPSHFIFSCISDGDRSRRIHHTKDETYNRRPWIIGRKANNVSYLAAETATGDLP